MSLIITKLDDELRETLRELTEDIYHEEHYDGMMRFILADRKKHELQARIDENNRWRTILAPSDDYNTADMEDFNDRVAELKQELEKL